MKLLIGEFMLFIVVFLSFQELIEVSVLLETSGNASPPAVARKEKHNEKGPQRMRKQTVT